jgi:hypothetical protein
MGEVERIGCCVSSEPLGTSALKEGAVGAVGVWLLPGEPIHGQEDVTKNDPQEEKEVTYH